MIVNNSLKFYTYAYLREDGTPYYIGKGSGGRAWDAANHRIRLPIDHKRIINPIDNSAPLSAYVIAYLDFARTLALAKQKEFAVKRKSCQRITSLAR